MGNQQLKSKKNLTFPTFDLPKAISPIHASCERLKSTGNSFCIHFKLLHCAYNHISILKPQFFYIAFSPLSSLQLKFHVVVPLHLLWSAMKCSCFKTSQRYCASFIHFCIVLYSISTWCTQGFPFLHTCKILCLQDIMHGKAHKAHTITRFGYPYNHLIHGFGNLICC